MSLLRYDGPPWPEHKPGYRGRWCGGDSQEEFARNSTNTSLDLPYGGDDASSLYCFNSLGYRGEEYQPEADFRIYAIGCSHTFGLGLKWEDTWPYLFKQKYQKRVGLDKNVNLLNFSTRAASNDYIARTAITQCHKAKPHLLLVLFTHYTRAEYLQAETVAAVQPGISNQISEAYYNYFTDEVGMCNSLKNILLVQFYCQANAIDYLFSWVEHDELDKLASADNKPLSNLATLIDRRYLTPFSLLDDKLIDLARDAQHAGPKTTAMFSEKVFARFCEVYDREGRDASTI